MRIQSRFRSGGGPVDSVHLTEGAFCGADQWLYVGLGFRAVRAGNPVNNVPEDQFNRPEEFEKRRSQQISFHAFPTTSIGSFPQTAGKVNYHAATRARGPYHCWKSHRHGVRIIVGSHTGKQGDTSRNKIPGRGDMGGFCKYSNKMH